MRSWSAQCSWCCQSFFLLHSCWCHLQWQSYIPIFLLSLGDLGMGDEPWAWLCHSSNTETHCVGTWWQSNIWDILGLHCCSLWKWMKLPTNGLIVKQGMEDPEASLALLQSRHTGWLPGPSRGAHVEKTWDFLLGLLQAD